jgi:catechol 2,3-dioxygenase-like lactoylglutathione lyase family enzyme
VISCWLKAVAAFAFGLKADRLTTKNQSLTTHYDRKERAMPTITGLHHVQITVTPDDVPAARAFYCGTLGLTEIPKPDSLAGRGGFWLQLGAQQMHVGTETGVDRSATKAHIAYAVDDLAGWRDVLAAAGITPLESIPIPGYDRFEFRDPFGNRVELIQPNA